MDAEDFADLATHLQANTDLGATGQSVVDSLRDLLPDADEVTLTIRISNRRHHTLAATNPVAQRLDECQYALSEGPCVDAANADNLIRSGDLGRDHRWPRWGPEAAAAGARSVLSVPLHRAGARADGALNMYSHTIGRFTNAEDRNTAAIFAIHAAHALRSADTVTGLETAVSSRHTIGTAQGILMSSYKLTLPQSLALLRRVSSHRNIKVRDLAAYVVEHGQLPESNDLGAARPGD